MISQVSELSHFSWVHPLATPWTVVTKSCLTLCQSSSRLLCSWDSLGQNAGVGCHAFPWGILPTQRSSPCFLHLLHWQVHSLSLAPHGRPQCSHILCNSKVFFPRLARCQDPTQMYFDFQAFLVRSAPQPCPPSPGSFPEPYCAGQHSPASTLEPQSPVPSVSSAELCSSRIQSCLCSLLHPQGQAQSRYSVSLIEPMNK